MIRWLALIPLLVLVVPVSAAPDMDDVVSPRLARVLGSKGLDPLAVEIWTQPGSAAPPNAEVIEPDHYLATYAPGDIVDLAATGSVAYLAPADPIMPPDSFDEPAETNAIPPAAVAKAVGLGRTAAWPTGTGRGVTIGVIDFGEAPANANVAALRNFGRPGTSPHSGVVLGILRRLAPDARLVFAALSPSTATSRDLQRATVWLEAQGARIVTFSGASYANRRDGLAPIDRIVDAQVARGIVWVTASGNEAQRSWKGLTTDRNRDGMVDIAAGRNAITFQAHGPVNLALTWDDWGDRGPPHGNWDIDMVVTDARGQIVGAERTRRRAIGEPVKTLQLARLTPGTYKISLPLRGAGSPVGVRLTATGMADFLFPAVPYASIGNPATARGAISVAAVDPRSAATSPYSGQGPTADQRPKPEFGASGAGSQGSVGTSYAAPRIAALAARVLSSHPKWSPAEVKAALGRYTQPLARRSKIGEASRWIDTRAHGDP